MTVAAHPSEPERASSPPSPTFSSPSRTAPHGNRLFSREERERERACMRTEGTEGTEGIEREREFLTQAGQSSAPSRMGARLDDSPRSLGLRQPKRKEEMKETRLSVRLSPHSLRASLVRRMTDVTDADARTNESDDGGGDGDAQGRCRAPYPVSSFSLSSARALKVWRSRFPPSRNNLGEGKKRGLRRQR